MKIKNQLEVKVVFKVSFWDALKMRLAGKFVDKYFEELAAKIKSNQDIKRSGFVQSGVIGDNPVGVTTSGEFVLTKEILEQIRKRDLSQRPHPAPIIDTI